MGRVIYIDRDIYMYTGMAMGSDVDRVMLLAMRMTIG